MDSTKKIVILDYKFISQTLNKDLDNFNNLYVSSRGRVVKALDLKSNGIFPRRFESCRLRNILFIPAKKP